MAIATILNVTGKSFLNSNPAKSGMSIDFGDVIETYDISKGLEESFKSDDPTDDGLMSLRFHSNGSEMKLKSHQKVIFDEFDLPPTSNNFKLSMDSECIVQDQNFDAYVDAMWASTVWNEIEEVTTKEYEVENITAASGVRG